VRQEAPAVFRSSGRGGFSDAIKSDPRHVEARKRPRKVEVHFAETDRTVQTSEGVVHAKPGDAILTGPGGEHWRVSRAHFSGKYQPVAPVEAGDAGLYRALPYRVLALRMSEPFEVVLSDGVSRLSGRAGDWLIDYGDGSLGIVAPVIFADTYEILS
jgi:hypothetical protein